MLATAGLPPQFWAEALASLLHVLNRTPTSSLPHTTSYKCWLKSKPDVSHLRVWGRLTYVHVQKDKEANLAPTWRNASSLTILQVTRAGVLQPSHKEGSHL